MRLNVLAKTAVLPFAFALAVLAQDKKTTCTNPTLSWTINSSYVDSATGITYTSQIQGDGLGAYSAVLFICSGSNDAVIQYSSSRTASITFGPQLDPGVTPPSFACNGCTVTQQPAMDVRHLGSNWSPATSTTNYNFTTGFNSSVPAGSGRNYGLHLLSPYADIVDPEEVYTNPPYTTYYDAVVHVQHCPAGTNQGSAINPVNPNNECPTLAKEKWFVWPDATSTPSQVSTLLNQRSGLVSAGQFSMPFFFTFTVN